MKIILKALDSETTMERRRAVSRLQSLFTFYSDDEGEEIRSKLKLANKNEKHKPLQIKMASLLELYENFQTQDERVAEANRLKNKEKIEAAQKEETKRLKKEKERKEKEA